MTIQWIIKDQWGLRVGGFLILLIGLGIWETRQTWHAWLESRRQRWVRNGTLFMLAQVMIRLIFPAFPVGVALVFSQGKIGIFRLVSLPYFLSVILGIIILDAMLYWQHRWLHRYRWLWRFHQVHHMDREVDVTTGLRFHPVEALFTTGVKVLSIGFFGIDVIAVLLFQAFYGIAILFTHVNVKLPEKIEKTIRLFFVTPTMHRIHHSDLPMETNSNYGFCLSIWDKLCHSYHAQPLTGEKQMVVGLQEYREPIYQHLDNLLWGPFYKTPFRWRRKKVPKLY